MTRVLLLFLLVAMSVHAQQNPGVAVFWEDGFPFVDTGQVARAQLTSALPGASLVTAEGLPAALLQARVVVLPHGSAFPEKVWPALLDFVGRGGNLVAVGGRPFTRPAFRDSNGNWKVRGENYAYARELNLIDYQPTSASTGTTFVPNTDVGDLAKFSWNNAWSLVIRLSEHDTSAREGAAGRIDARLTPLAWGVQEGRKLSAPVVEIDHLTGHFAGGKWVVAAADLHEDFLPALPRLVQRAERGAEEFRVQIGMPLLLPGESVRLTMKWRRFGAPPPQARVQITITPEQGKPVEQTLPFSASEWPVEQAVELPPATGKGLHKVTAVLASGREVIAVARTGFWMRDLDYLRSGPALARDRDFFRLDGKPLPVVGTTYMSSDAQRLFFDKPNPYVWDSDMSAIAGRGLNMLRTGWWSGWDDLVDNGVATEKALRTMEAFLMSARRHGLPVQWTLFAFMPEVFGGGNPYLNAEALRRQREFVSSIASRFHDVPFLVWDLVNEPSFDDPARFWTTRPSGDVAEQAAWNDWVLARYGDRSAVADAWRMPIFTGDIPLPANRDFGERAAYVGGHPVAAYDFHLFAQEKFAAWAGTMRDAIRAAGSQQLITVGQDEGGGIDRPSPVFYGSVVDFTTTHTWWLNDALLWDSLVARAPGKPMLTQETGFQREWAPDGRPRRTPESEAAVLERKIAVALGTGAGAIQWLWNVNSWMTSEQEVTIGAVRPDGTEKPEVEVMGKFAKFAALTREHFSKPELPEVAIVTSQALQYSVLGNAAIEAQQRAVRVLHYGLHVPAYVITENQLGSLDNPKLVILPSAQGISEPAWKKLVDYVKGGGNLLVTGSPERDDRWRPTDRLRALGIEAAPEPLTFRAGEMQIDQEKVTAEFPGPRQLTLESLRMVHGWVEKKVGLGTLIVAAYPVELADNPDPVRLVYAAALKRSSIQPSFQGTLPAAVLARPVAFDDSVLYLLVSESGANAAIDLVDRISGGHVKLLLPSQRAALLLLDRKTGAVLAKTD